MSIRFLVFGFLFVFIVSGCTGIGTIYYPDGKKARRLEIASFLETHPLQAGESFKIIDLGKTDRVSSHLVWIRHREKPHIHSRHDATVRLIQGHGTLTLDRQQIVLKPGNLITIPRGVPHGFVNESSEPAAAYVVFSPPFDKDDIVGIVPMVH